MVSVGCGQYPAVPLGDTSIHSGFLNMMGNIGKLRNIRQLFITAVSINSWPLLVFNFFLYFPWPPLPLSCLPLSCSSLTLPLTFAPANHLHLSPNYSSQLTGCSEAVSDNCRCRCEQQHPPIQYFRYNSM